MADLQYRLRCKERTLVRDYFDVCDAASYCKIQDSLLTEIIDTERLLEHSRSEKNTHLIYKNHIQRCRVIGDSLAWSVFTPHVIRQLSKNPAKPPFLKNQIPANKSAHAVINEYANRSNIIAIHSDLTHVIRIGDVVAAVEEERPEIIEVKESKPKSHKPSPANREGRQFLRMQSTLDYIKHDRVKMFNEKHERMAISSGITPEYSWALVEEICSKAMKNGEALCTPNQFEFMSCSRSDHDIETVLSQIHLDKDCPVIVGDHTRFLDDEITALVPPVLNWPLNTTIRESLFFGEINLLHAVDPTGLTGQVNSHGEIGEYDTKNGAYPIIVKGKERWASENWLTWLVYGYETLQSVRKRMVDIVCQIEHLENL